MKYEELAEVYEKLETEPGKLEKTRILAEFFGRTEADILPSVVLLASGKVFPSYSDKELGIASKMMIKAIGMASGLSEDHINNKFRELGDLGLVAEGCVESKKQTTLFKEELTVERVHEALAELAEITGSGSQDRKLGLITDLLTSAKPKEARYVVRTILKTLRIGVAEGITRDAIAKAFEVDAGKVEDAWNRISDYGKVAKVAKEKGIEGLEGVRLEVGKPIRVLLAESASNIEAAIEKYEEPAIEWKFDGIRIQIHKKSDEIKLFTRRLEDVTVQFPELVERSKLCLRAKECVVEGELLAVNSEDRPLPFQKISQRVQRKYEIDDMVRNIPTQLNLFDVVYVDGEMLFDRSLRERREILEAIVESREDFRIAKQIATRDIEEAKRYNQGALDAGQEGIMVKNLRSKYQPGRRVGYWLKVKPEVETLDLTVVGAEWGTGKRAHWLSSFVLACRDSYGNFLPCGMMGTGLTDEEFQAMTDKLEPLITEEKGREVKITPRIVLEVGYEEIQESPNYEAGYALRFPRLIRDRTADKSPDEADTVDRVKELHEKQ